MQKNVLTNLLLITSMSMAIVACAEPTPTLDTTSEERSKQSMQQIRDSLSEDKLKDFESAVMTLMLSSMGDGGIASLASASESDVEGFLASAKSNLNGLTAEQVINRARVIKEKQEERQRKKALDEIEELKKKQSEAAEARAYLDDFVIESSSYSREEVPYTSRETPVIDLRVTNKTPEAISRVFFRGVLVSPNRSVPWVDDTFNYSIPGGIEPGETLEWNLSLNSFSAWANDDIPNDVILNITVEKVEGADGETLWDARGLDEFEQLRLESLKDKYAQN